jgi:divalent metal cation (Fe/Co/Zn/Cd) transporter
MKTKTTSIIAAVIGTLCAAFAAFVYWQALAVLAAGYPVHPDERLIWFPLCAAVIFWAVAGYGFISRRKHGHDHAA